MQPVLEIVTDGQICWEFFCGSVKRWKPEASPRLIAPAVSRSFLPGRFEIPANGGASVVYRAGYPVTGRSMQRDASSVRAAAHGPSEEADPDSHTDGNAPSCGVVCLGPVEGGLIAEAARPAEFAGVLLDHDFFLPARHIPPRPASCSINYIPDFSRSEKTMSSGRGHCFPALSQIV